MSHERIGILPLVHYCDGCGTGAIDHESAVECCGGPVGIGYCCPICGIPYEHEQDAVACCDWDRTPEGARSIQRKMEAAGQLALDV